MPLTNITNTPTTQRTTGDAASKYAEYLLAEPEASPDREVVRLRKTVEELETALRAKDADLVLAAEAGFNLIQEKSAVKAEAKAREAKLVAAIEELEAKLRASGGAGGSRVSSGLLEEFQGQVDAARADAEAKSLELTRMQGQAAATERRVQELEEALADAQDAAHNVAKLRKAVTAAEHKLEVANTKHALELQAAADSNKLAQAAQRKLVALEREHEQTLELVHAMRADAEAAAARIEALEPVAAAAREMREELEFVRSERDELKSKVEGLKAQTMSLRSEVEELRASGGGDGGASEFAHASSLFAVQMNEEKMALQANLEAERQSRLATEHELKHKIEVNLAENARHISELEAREIEHKRSLEALRLAAEAKDAADAAQAAADRANALHNQRAQAVAAIEADLAALAAERDAAKAAVDAARARSDEKAQAVKAFKLLRMKYSTTERKLAAAKRFAAKARVAADAKLADLDAKLAAAQELAAPDA